MIARRRPPGGYVVLTLAEYEALRNATRTRPSEPATADPWATLASAVACITARVDRIPVDLAELTEGVPTAPLIRLLAGLAASAFRELTADQGESLLRDLGRLAAGPADNER